MIDIVTVVFQQELETLRIQAQSIDLYCDPSTVGSIIVVVNDTPDIHDQIDCQWWGQFSHCVCIVNRSQFGNNWTDNGWVSQQVLKIMGAATGNSPWSLVLDAKTILLKNIMDNLLDDQGRVNSGSLKIYEVFYPSKQIVDQLFGIQLNHQIGPGGVPFVFSNQLIRDMILHIEQQVCDDFSAWFQQQGRLTEFILYSGYVVYAGRSDLYNLDNSCLNPVNVGHNETGIWDSKIRSMQTDRPCTVSVHRNAWQLLTSNQKHQYRTFLLQNKITSAELLQ